MKSSVQDFYEQQWGSTAEAREAGTILLMMERAIQYSYSLLGDLSGKKLLEIGAGAGHQAVYFAQRGAKVMAIDISAASLRSVQELALHNKINNIQLQHQNAEQLTFPDNTFDLIYINSTLMHVNHEKVFRECSRVLKLGGKLVVVEPLRYNPFMMVYRLFSKYRYTHPRYMTVKEFLHFQPYFTSLHHQEFYFFSLLALPLFAMMKKKNLAVRCMNVIETIDGMLGRLVPVVRRMYWMGVVWYQK